MEPERWRQLEELYHAALKLHPGQRADFLSAQCHGDKRLLSAVDSLLQENVSVDSVLDHPAFEAAAKLLAARADESARAEDPLVGSTAGQASGSHLHLQLASPLSTFNENRPFCGTNRFIVKRQLGAGGFGAVYQVWDTAQQRTLALKQLKLPRPENIARFKTEFRILSELRHQNLIRLYELFGEDENWFFTMELIDGVNFLECLRSEEGKCDYDKLRLVVRQLVEGLAFLHLNHKVHRDLKPANVLITTSQRPVILDFGLVRDLGADFHHQTFSMVGTPAYMSPEQSHQMEITPASDWYSLGVMIYEVLAGRMPVFNVGKYGPELEHQPQFWQPDIPETLNSLCSQLLCHEPANRPGPQKVLELLGEMPGGTAKVESVGKPQIFIGRVKELDCLYSAFADTQQQGNLNVVLIEGRSGIGKSTLVRTFIEFLSTSQSNLVVLRGKCREFEYVPYKGVDSLIDDLAQFLQHAPDAKVRELLPRDAFLLPKLFPTLGKVRQIAHAPARGGDIADAQELRQRIFAALRELLGRLAERVPVLVWIDDLQWGDRDSSLLLEDLCAPPGQPPLLLLLSYRSEDVSFSPTIEHFQNALATKTRDFRTWRHLLVEGLEENESLELLRATLGKSLNQNLEEKIVRDASGHPLLISQLARLAGSHDLTAGSAHALDLQSILQARTSALPAVARELLELLCLAAQPLSENSLSAAARLGSQADHIEAVQLLLDLNLAKTSRWRQDTRRLEPFHDQIRTAVRELMGAPLQRGRHGQIAQMLAKDGSAEPQLLMTHLKESGNLPAAYQAALQAGKAAEDQLAFDRAAVFYQTAIELGEPQRALADRLHHRLADALAKAGRGRDSAHSYLKAAELGDGDPMVMRRLSIDQLMRSGYIDEALKAFQELADKVGLRTVHSPMQAIVGIVKGRIAVRVRLLRGLPSASSRATGLALMRLELLRTGGIVLAIADPVMATYYQVQYLLESIRVRDPAHLAQALAMEAGIRVARGRHHKGAVLRILDHAEEIARRSLSANASGFVCLCRMYTDYLAGDVQAGIEHCDTGIPFFREHCVGVAWELTISYVMLIWFKCWGGHIRDVRDLLPQLLKEGAARGDWNVEVSLRLLTYAHYAYLSADEPEQCLVECERAITAWSTTGFHRHHYGALFIRVETNLYLGRYTQARQLLTESWPRLSKSFLLQEQILKIMALFLHGRVSLACWLSDRGDPGLRAEVESCAKKLKRINSPWVEPFRTVLHAGIAAGRGGTLEASEMLEHAQEGFQGISLHAYASAAAYLAKKLKNPPIESEAATVNEFLVGEGIRNPNAFMRMLLPGDWV